MSNPESLRKACNNLLKDCMRVKPDEKVLIVTDQRLISIGLTLFEQALSITPQVILVQIPIGEFNGQEPPEDIAELMSRYSVVIAPTTRSLTHTNARRNACAKGARVGTMPGITPKIMERTLLADYRQIEKRTLKLKEVMESVETIRIKTELGTDLTLPIKGQKIIASTGIVDKPGTFGNLPSGEVYLTPIEGQAEGIFVVDASMAGIGKIQDKPIRITVKNGMATMIEGGREAKILKEQIEKIGDKARNIGEFGIGTNDKAIVSGNILEDEKVMGTVHIALGNNLSMGGTVDVPFHVDGIILKPDVWFDEKKVMERGRLLIED